ncbi:MAG: hypothetical protein U5L76_03850 [Patescibacteria group bacterium]|nr:hypothetical protein [Patescibacteria group bacterium]
MKRQRNKRSSGSKNNRNRIEAQKRKRRKEVYSRLENKKPVRPKRFVTHLGPHIDELWSIDILRQELKRLFPETKVNELPIIFQTDNVNVPFEGKDGWQHLNEGTYILGCGGDGPFNHHPPKKYPEICTADQVVVFLDIYDKPEYQMLLKRIRSNDLNGGGEYGVLAETLRFMDISDKDKLEKALSWLKVHIDLLIEAQKEFFSEAKKRALKEKSRVWVVEKGKEKIPVITINGCDDEDIHRLANYLYKAEVIICRRTSGNVQIFRFPCRNRKFFNKVRVNLGVAAAINRFNEQKANGISEPDDYLPNLICNGFHHGWQYDTRPGWIFNGTRNMPVDPTGVPLARIEEAVKLALQYHPNFNWVPFIKKIKDLPLSETMINMKAKLKNLADKYNGKGR